MRPCLPLLLLAALAVTTAPDARADDPGGTACLPKVVAPWVRMAPAAMPMGAGFATISNPCPREMVVTAVKTPDFGATSLHATRVENGVSRMRSVSRLVIPAKGRVELKPGGMHLMLMQPSRNLVGGKLVRIDFQLSDGRIFGADFPVREPGA